MFLVGKKRLKIGEKMQYTPPRLDALSERPNPTTTRRLYFDPTPIPTNPTDLHIRHLNKGNARVDKGLPRRAPLWYVTFWHPRRKMINRWRSAGESITQVRSDSVREAAARAWYNQPKGSVLTKIEKID